MDRRVVDPLAGVPPQSVRPALRVEAKADRQELADLRPVVGHLVERAFALMGITKQEAAFRMAYRDAGAVSRWCSGTERPLFDKLFALDGFRIAYVTALAEADPRLEVTTTITIRQVA
jgi:hypothetical protein